MKAQPPELPSRTSERGFMHAAAIFLAGLAATTPYWKHWFILSNDGPEHLYTAWIWLHHDQLPEHLAELVQVHTPLTNHAFPVLFALGEALLGWQIGFWSSQVLILGCVGAGLAALMLRISPNAYPLVPVAPVLANGWLAMAGFLNFEASLLMVVVAVLLTAGVARFSVLRHVAILVTISVASLLHTYGANLAMAALLSMQAGSWVQGQTGAVRAGARLLLWSVPLLLLNVWVWLNYQATFSDNDLIWWATDSWVPHIVLTGAAGPWWRSMPPVLMGLAGLVAALLLDTTRLRSRVGWVLLAVGYTALWWALPFTWSGWQGLSPRSAPLALAASIALLPMPGHNRARATLGILTAAWGTAALAWTANLQADLRHGCSELISVLETPPDVRGTMVLATTGSCAGNGDFRDSPWMPKLRTTEHLDGALAVATRSLHIGFEGTPTIHTYTIRPFFTIRPGRATGQEFKKITQVLHQFQAEGRPGMELWAGQMAMSEELTLYDHVWVLHPDESLLSTLHSSGWVSVQQWPTLHLLSWRPCSLEVMGPLPPRDDLWLEYGWLPLGPDAPYSSLPFQHHPDGFRASVQRAPCSPVWVRARTADGAVVPCAGADQNGLLLAGADTARTGRIIECVAAPTTNSP